MDLTQTANRYKMQKAHDKEIFLTRIQRSNSKSGRFYRFNIRKKKAVGFSMLT